MAVLIPSSSSLKGPHLNLRWIGCLSFSLFNGTASNSISYSDRSYSKERSVKPKEKTPKERNERPVRNSHELRKKIVRGASGWDKRLPGIGEIEGCFCGAEALALQERRAFSSDNLISSAPESTPLSNMII